MQNIVTYKNQPDCSLFYRLVGRKKCVSIAKLFFFFFSFWIEWERIGTAIGSTVGKISSLPVWQKV